MRCADLQQQLHDQGKDLQVSSNRAELLSSDNQTLKDAVDRLRQDIQLQTDECKKYLGESNDLRSANRILQAAKDAAEDARATAQHQLESIEQVRLNDSKHAA